MSNNQTFSINAKTCTLKYNIQEGQAAILGTETKYNIPIFQRPYSWTDEQITKFISDIFISFWGHDGDTIPEPMFIGTMQLTPNKELLNTQDIIDGQQRLTTLLIFIKVLKNRYTTCEELNNLSLNWLNTNVNNGKQQIYLEEFIQSNLLINEDTLNPYLKNAYLITNLLESHTKNIDDTELVFDIIKFIEHFLSNIYFVVIETKAGLSKTLQIFNAINTTGLDLNGGDIFKIRMYEYLKDKEGKGENSFVEISELYSKIDEQNAKFNKNITTINDILGIYQYELIAKYKLPVTLYYLSTDTFYERLFDTIFNINQWEHFKNNIGELKIRLEDIDKIIDVRYDWESKKSNNEGFSAEDICAINFILHSRYSRYWNLIFVFLSRNTENNKWQNMLYLTKQLSKLFIIYSVRFQKIKSDIYYGFMQKVIHSIVNESFKEIITTINNQIGNEEYHNDGWYDLNYFLSEKLTENAKRKNLICRLSAMIDDNYESTDKNTITRIYKSLFETSIDIEHIQSYHDIDIEKREIVWDDWGDDINSLGNLMILEQEINRSISNSNYEHKINQYSNSQFSTVKKQIESYPTIWSLSNCKKRKKTETDKILRYLFSNN